MTKWQKVSVFAATAACFGCASQTDLVNMKRDLDEVAGRLVRTEKQVGSVGTEARSGIEKSAKDFQKDLDTLRKNQAEYQASMEAVRVDMQVLAGKVDDVSIQAKKPMDDIALVKEDAERNLRLLKDQLEKMEKEIQDLRKQLAEKPKPAPEAETAQSLYQKSLDAFRGGDVAKAKQGFTSFLERYPENELAVNARYWIGETYFQEKKYEQAILEFQELINRYPGREKTAAALLKQGMAFTEIGDTKSARFVYRKIMEEFPVSDEAAKAKDKRKDLK